jgi:hypothetical protein
VHDFIGPKDISMDLPVSGGSLDNKEGDPKPEQGKEAMKWGMGAVGVLPVESRKLTSKDEITKLMPSFLISSCVVLVDVRFQVRNA